MISQSFFNNPTRLKRCTGLTVDQFTTLCQLVEPLWQREKVRAYLKRATRRIKKKRKKISSWEDLEREFPEIAEIFVDATEQQRQRPKKQVQRQYYSLKI